MLNDSHQLDVAVFIDFENVYVSVRDKLDANPNFEMIMDRCVDFGRVVIARAYADWYRYPRVTSALYANGIEPMYVPTYYYDRDMGRTGRAIKNSVDMNLCIDAMKTLYTNTNISRFVLATGDRDFIPLVNSIRQHGKEVIIIGVGGAASAHLAQSADEFIFYEQLVGKKSAALQPDMPRAKMPEKGREQPEVEEEVAKGREREVPREKEATHQDIYDVLVSAIRLARERGYVCSFGSLKLLMKELLGGDFKEGKYKDASGKPFAKFKDFVLEAERRNKVQVFTSGTVNEVFLPGEDPYKLSQFAQELKEEAVAPVITPVPLEAQATQAAAPSSGRRRRRRSRRRADQPSLELEPQEEEVEVEEIVYTPLPEPVPELIDNRADAIFAELLERVEEEAAERESLVELPEPDLIGRPAIAEDGLVGEVVEVGALPMAHPFTSAEWQLLNQVMLRYERPVSFAQIHDALRDARNHAGLSRTNEELRTLIKQAINSGMLDRSGKGNRITYRLSPQPELAMPIAADREPSDQAMAWSGAPEVRMPEQARAEVSPSMPPDGVTLADQTSWSAASEDETPVFHSPEAAGLAGLVLAETQEPETPTVIDAEESALAEAAPKAKPKRSRAKKPTAASATDSSEPVKPKRVRRKPTEQA